MARSVPIWKILRFAKVSLYLERFVPRHATAHIHNVATHLKKRNAEIQNLNNNNFNSCRKYR